VHNKELVTLDDHCNTGVSAAENKEIIELSSSWKHIKAGGPSLGNQEDTKLNSTWDHVESGGLISENREEINLKSSGDQVNAGGRITKVGSHANLISMRSHVRTGGPITRTILLNQSPKFCLNPITISSNNFTSPLQHGELVKNLKAWLNNTKDIFSREDVSTKSTAGCHRY
jgi:hypothetical protein